MFNKIPQKFVPIVVYSFFVLPPTIIFYGYPKLFSFSHTY